MGGKTKKKLPGQVRRVLQYSNEEERAVLRRVSEPVPRVNRQIRRLAEDMIATMYDYDGVGLAAPQVGVMRRVIVVDVGDGPFVLINPEITRRDGTDESFEGCLSIPEYVGSVERAARVEVTGLDERGRRVWIDGEGLLARVLQHEVDHLNGVLFLDKASEIVAVPPEARLRIVYMGTPEFAVPTLEHLADKGFKVVGVVTRPDRARGRGGRVQPPPVKETALELELDVMQPESVRDPDFIASVRELRPDVIITCAFGAILPPELLEVPKVGAFNIHASLLPRWRGAAPIQRALMAGDTETGITIFYMDEGMDTGDILLQRAVPIHPDDDAGSVHDRLAALAPEAMVEALKLLAGEEEAPREPQDHGAATVAPMLKSDDEWISWSEPADAVVNKCRGLAPRPGAVTMYGGKRLKILQAEAAGRPGDAQGARANNAPAPGTVLDVTPGAGFTVAAGRGAVVVRKVQPEGARAMAAADFINGYGLAVGDVLG